MKHIRATARVDPADAPAFFSLLAHSPDVDEARVVDVNTSIGGTETMLLAIDGDPTAFAEGAAETPGVDSVELIETDRRAYALLVMRPMDTPLFRSIHESGAEAGFVIRTPIVYRDGTMTGRVVGDPESLQQSLSQAPDTIDISIDEIGTFPGSEREPTGTLSERQREALHVARDLGYYDQPRKVTHADIAAELDCAPATASDHLQKAEAKLVTAVLDEFGPDV